MGAYASIKHALEANNERIAQDVKLLKVWGAIVEPGIINTQLASAFSVDQKSIYPHFKRLGVLFSASLQTSTAATLVADQILEIAESNTWKLRNPVSPDAQALSIGELPRPMKNGGIEMPPRMTIGMKL